MGLVLADGVIFSHHTAAKLYGAPIAADSQLHVESSRRPSSRGSRA